MNQTKDKWTFNNNAYEKFGIFGLDIMKLNMKLLKDLLDQNGIKLNVAVYPWPSQILYEDNESIQVKIWEEWCKNHKVNFYNFFPFFTNKGSNKEKMGIINKYYILGDYHFNEKGNKIIADNFLESYVYPGN